MKNSNVDRILIAKLQSGKPSVILEALREIKVAGTAALIPSLFDIVARGKDELIIEEVLRILSDIKEKDAVPYIVESIRRQSYGSHAADVLAVCWQSSLDFSPYIDVFTDIFTSADYQASIEAFSVIEEAIYHTSVSKRQECLKILDQKENNVTPEKKPLFNELVKLLKASLTFTIDNSKNIS